MRAVCMVNSCQGKAASDITIQFINMLYRIGCDTTNICLDAGTVINVSNDRYNSLQVSVSLSRTAST